MSEYITVVAGEKYSTTGREVHRIDAEDDAAFGVAGHLAVRSKVKQATLDERDAH